MWSEKEEDVVESIKWDFHHRLERLSCYNDNSVWGANKMAMSGMTTRGGEGESCVTFVLAQLLKLLPQMRKTFYCSPGILILVSENQIQL